MASVQELLAAADAQSSPLTSLLKGLTQGLGQGYQQAPERAMQQLQLQQLRTQQAYQDKARQDLDNQIATQTEARTKQNLGAVGGTPDPVQPTTKLQREIEVDAKGNIVTKYKTADVAPKSFESKDYQDANGDTRRGAFNPATGKIIQSSEDPLAPEPAASVSLGEKQQQYTQKRLTAFGDALDPSKARAGAFGVSKQVYDRAERLQSLASAFPGGNMDSRQIEEMAVGLNAMLSGSNTGASTQVKALVPSSAMGDAMKLKEWLANDPQGTNQQAFVARMLGSVEREKATAADQITRTQMQRTTRFADLEKSVPDDFYNVMQSAGLDPADYKKWKTGGFKPISATQQPPAAAAPAGTAHPLVGTKVGNFIITAVN